MIALITWLVMVVTAHAQQKVEGYYEPTPFKGLTYFLGTPPSGNYVTTASVFADPNQLTSFQTLPLSSLTITGGILVATPPTITTNIVTVTVTDRSVSDSASFGNEWYLINLSYHYGYTGSLPVDVSTLPATILGYVQTTTNQDTITGITIDAIGALGALRGMTNTVVDGHQFNTNTVTTISALIPLWGN